MKTQTARQRLLASTVIGGAAMLAVTAAPAYAQEEPTEVETVVVTGSRIIRQDFEAISPVTTVGSEQLELTATLTVDTLLNELPQIVPGNTRTSNNAGGEDFATVDLRGLGANRTLVLVNGERIPGSSTTGVVDINTIPASLIDRVEVVTGGASAVYGSDAIAGVVNFILKDDYEGAEITATYGSSFEGHAPEFEINGLLGGNFANGRGNITAYASYYNRELVSQSEFDYSRVSGAVCQTASGAIKVCDTLAEANAVIAGGGGIIFNGGSSTPAWGVIPGGQGFQNLDAILPGQFGAGTYDTNCDGVPNAAPFGSGTLSFDDNGMLSPYQGSLACAVPERSGIRGGSSRYNYAPDNYLIIPAERFNITTTATYDVTDTLRAKVMMNYVNNATEVQLAPTPAGPGTEITIDPNPTMLAFINTVAPDLAAAIAGRANPDAPFLMYRRFNEVGPRTAYQENNSFYLISTLDGQFNDNWNWSLTASYGSNRFDVRGTNSVNSTALNQGLAGCVGQNLLPGCVPLDVFGAGTLTDQMVDFIRVNTFSTTQVEESRVAGFVRGDLFELPAGPIAAVFGFEYRDTAMEFRVDNEQRSGNIKGFNALQDQEGSIQVAELYTEVSVPLIKDAPLADYLGLEAGFRYSDYSSVGEVETFKVGAEWAPVEWLRFRAIYNEATRAPNVFELFQAGDQGFPAYTDPCDTNNAPSAQLLAFCSSQAGGFDFTGFEQSNAQTQAFAYGNPDLRAETAETWTAGVVFQPDFFPVGSLRIAADYYDMHIEDVITALGAGFFINQCYNGLGQTPASAAACARIERSPITGDIISVETTRTNLGYQETKGWDIQAEWSVDLEDTFLPIPGRLRVNELLTLVDSYDINGVEYTGYTFSGIGGAIFDWKSTLSVYYTLGDWTAFARWSYLPELTSGNFGDTTPAASYIDVSARWNVTDSFQVTGFIGNLFDELPPQTAEGVLGGQGNTDVQVYRPLGRTFSVSAKLRF